MSTDQDAMGPGSIAAAIAAGAVMGTLLAAGNVYAGLKIGFTSDGSLVAAILAIALIRGLGRLLPTSFTARHTNLTQTAASAGAFCAVAGLTNAVPAMHMSGVSPSPWLLLPWVFFIAALGICIAVPLRRRAIEVDKLRFPSGVVCAETIRTLHAKAGRARQAAATLGGAAAFSSAVTWLRDAGIPGLLAPPIPMKTTLPGSLGAFSLKSLSLGIAWSPLLFAVGAIVGLRIGLSLVLGAGLGWVLGGPLLASHGLIDPEAKRAIVTWTVWPAVGLITAGGLTALLAGGGVFRRALDLFRRSPARQDPVPGAVPRTWWLGGLAAAGLGTTIAAWAAFGVPVWQSLVAILLALPIAAVAIRAVGETDMSPSNNLAKVTQFVFAGLAPGQTVANVAAAGVASGCAIEASEVMTDLKSGASSRTAPATSSSRSSSASSSPPERPSRPTASWSPWCPSATRRSRPPRPWPGRRSPTAWPEARPASPPEPPPPPGSPPPPASSSASPSPSRRASPCPRPSPSASASSSPPPTPSPSSSEPPPAPCSRSSPAPSGSATSTC